MPDTGLKSPSATGEDYTDFTNPTNAYSSDDTYATATTNAEAQDWYNYTFGLAGTETIVGIEMTMEDKDNNTGDSVKYNPEISPDGGTTYVQGTNWQRVSSTIEGTRTAGGAAQLWGRVWSASDFTNANFRSRITIADMRNATLYSLDHIQVKVYYTEAPTSTGMFAMFN